MNVQCNVGCLPRDLIYQAKANSVKAISSWDAATQQMTQWGCNVQGVAIRIRIPPHHPRVGELRSNKGSRHTQACREDNARWQVSYHWKILIYLYLIWCEYFMVLDRSNLNTDAKGQYMLMCPREPWNELSSELHYDTNFHFHFCFEEGNAFRP